MALGLAGGATTPPIYPTGPSSTDYVAAGFIPESGRGKLIEKFYAATVLAAISNTDYEGEIKSYGDSVKIRTKPTLIINNYLVNGDLGAPKASRVERRTDHRPRQVFRRDHRRRDREAVRHQQHVPSGRMMRPSR